MRRGSISQLPILSWSVLAVCYGFAINAVLSSDGAWRWYFSADTLSFPALYRDLVVDHFSPRGWTFSAATFLVPDGLVYFAIQALVPGFQLALYVFGLLQVLTLAVACWWIAQRVLSDGARIAGALSAILLAVIVVALGGAWSRQPEWQIPMLQHMVLPVNHIGALVVTLIGLGWTLRAMRVRLSALETAVAGICLVTAVFSDRLVIPEFILPAALVWSASGDRRRWHVIALFATAAIVGVEVVGVLATRPEQALAGLAEVTTAQASARRLMVDVLNRQGASRLVQIAWGIGMVVALVELVRTWNRAQLRDRRWVPALFAVVAPLGVGIAVLAKGLYVDEASLRYLMGAWLLPILMLPILLMPRQVRRPLVSASTEIVMSCGVMLLTLLTVRPEALQLHPDVTLPLAECLDRLTERHRIQFGVGGYWESKPVMLFSQRDVRLYPVQPDLTPYHWISNRFWQQGEPGSRFPDPQYTFVVLNGVDRDRVLARFGEPAERVPCQDADVWIYDRDTDVAFHHLFR